jgi:hypothetical protein
MAIRVLNGFQLPTGVTISVSHPRQRDRVRSNSNATQKTSFRTPRDFQEFNPNPPRRQTLRQRAYSNNGPILMGIQSHASEIAQHQAAMDRLPLRSMPPLGPMPGLPLGSMENLPPKPQTKSNIPPQKSPKDRNHPEAQRARKAVGTNKARPPALRRLPPQLNRCQWQIYPS